MQTGIDLGMNRRIDDGVAVACGVDGDAGVEVEEAVAIDVLDDRTRTASDHERVDASE